MQAAMKLFCIFAYICVASFIRFFRNAWVIMTMNMIFFEGALTEKAGSEP